MSNKRYVITGGPGSGKTTLIRALEARGLCVVHESARAYIEARLAAGRTIEEIRSDPERMQKEILLLKLDRERNAPSEVDVFLDRGIPDTLGYHRYLGLPESTLIIESTRKSLYERVFLLNLLPLQKDQARTENSAEQEGLHAAIAAVYREYGFPLVEIPVLPVEDRVDLVLSML